MLDAGLSLDINISRWERQLDKLPVTPEKLSFPPLSCTDSHWNISPPFHCLLYVACAHECGGLGCHSTGHRTCHFFEAGSLTLDFANSVRLASPAPPYDPTVSFGKELYLARQ